MHNPYVAFWGGKSNNVDAIEGLCIYYIKDCWWASVGKYDVVKCLSWLQEYQYTGWVKKNQDLKPETSLKSLMLRKLLDQSTFAYWALLDLIFHYYSFHLSHRYEWKYEKKSQRYWMETIIFRDPGFVLLTLYEYLSIYTTLNTNNYWY